MSKEKTREIKVWVDPEDLNNKCFYVCKIQPFDSYLPATLLIKEPERKVEITESQFAQMAREIEYERKRSEKLIEALEIIGILPTSDELKTSKDCEEYYISVAKQALKEYRGEK